MTPPETATPARRPPAGGTVTSAHRPLIGPALGAALLWIGSRLTMLALFFGLEISVWWDVYYYFTRVAGLPTVGLGHTLVEYPTPVVWWLQLPYLLGGRDQVAYVALFMVLMGLLDAALTGWLWLRGRRAGSTVAAYYWMVFTMLIGPLVYTRFDLLPSVLAAVALLLLARAPGVSGGLVAIGAAVKLWPALLITGLFGRRHSRVAVWIGFAVTGVILVVLSLVTGGWDRLVSPLTWQGERGLQIESVWATPAMVNVLAHPGRYVIQFSQYQAYEVFGPGVGAMLTVASVATVVGGLAILALGVRAWRSPGHDLYTDAMIMTAVIAVMIITNKTFSPQYLIWLGGPLAVLVLTRTGRAGATDRGLLVLPLVLAVLTQLIFPLFYSWLTDAGPGTGRTLMTLVLALRNIGMLAFTVMAFGRAWSLLGGAGRREAVVEDTAAGPAS
ncbi:glycosyltransferase family 87 protein [Raineyella sp. W15-4]|uniref:glycosyltransferase family 87 protein n=1 Tax=Raineyella sp. W15-4 TaxID=3081651 RepID=UPI0029542FFB|nr:glycosyltransferase family 87 protein [Raineyella sp. W15-4]WOQ15529.1 glycosyltransferase family 87 protein [Raineyella sp. W15-4]